MEGKRGKCRPSFFFSQKEIHFCYLTVRGNKKTKKKPQFPLPSRSVEPPMQHNNKTKQEGSGKRRKKKTPPSSNSKTFIKKGEEGVLVTSKSSQKGGYFLSEEAKVEGGKGDKIIF